MTNDCQSLLPLMSALNGSGRVLMRLDVQTAPLTLKNEGMSGFRIDGQPRKSMSWSKAIAQRPMPLGDSTGDGVSRVAGRGRVRVSRHLTSRVRLREPLASTPSRGQRMLGGARR
jgi:hypothetical protein